LDVLVKSMVTVEKMLMAGAAVSAPAGEPTPGSGFALRRESLEGVSSPAKPSKKKKRRRLTKSEALDMIHTRHPNISRRAAERIWQFASERKRS